MSQKLLHRNDSFRKNILIKRGVTIKHLYNNQEVSLPANVKFPGGKYVFEIGIASKVTYSESSQIILLL